MPVAAARADSGRTADPAAWGEGRAPRLGPRHYDGGVDEYWGAVVWGLIPTIVVAGLLVFVLRSILRMDRTERKVYAKVEAEERRRRGLPRPDEKAG